MKQLALAATLLALLVVNPSNADSPIRPGDRIAIIGNTFADQLRVHGYLETLLLQHTNLPRALLSCFLRTVCYTVVVSTNRK